MTEEEERRAVQVAWDDQFNAAQAERFAPDPNDGPLAAEAKALFRKFRVGE